METPHALRLTLICDLSLQAKQTVETARSQGIQHMLNETGLTTAKHKASLDYITSLINNKDKITPYINLGAGLQKSVA